MLTLLFTVILLVLLGVPCVAIPLIGKIIQSWMGFGAILLLIAFELAGVVLFLAILEGATS